MSSPLAPRVTAEVRQRLPIAAPPAPSYPLVAAHFGLSFGWAVLGFAGLVWLAPVLASGTWLDPRLLGLVHFFTLGWLATVITGVLYQIIPVMLGVSIRSPRLAWVSLGMHTLGTAALAAGLWRGAPSLLAPAWMLLLGGVCGTALNLMPARRRAVRNRQLGIYVSYAHSGFGIAMALGGARIGDALGWWTTPRLELLAAHYHFAVVGFATLMAFGAASRMVPMFLGVTEVRPGPVRWLPRVLATGTVCFGVGAIGRLPVLAWIGVALMAGGVLRFIVMAAGWFRHRSRRPLDPATALILSSLAWLSLALGKL